MSVNDHSLTQVKVSFCFCTSAVVQIATKGRVCLVLNISPNGVRKASISLQDTTQLWRWVSSSKPSGQKETYSQDHALSRIRAHARHLINITVSITKITAFVKD